MQRLIDANALKEYIDCGHLRTPTELCFSECDVLRMLDEQTTIDAEPVQRGMWAWHEEWGHSSISELPELLDAYWMCSACGTDLLQYLKSHFPDIPKYTECSEEEPTLERCPSCGAKMGWKRR